jgi:hypothetical protein
MMPIPGRFLALEPEELAGVLLEYFNALSHDDLGRLNRYIFSLSHSFPEAAPEGSSRPRGRCLVLRAGLFEQLVLDDLFPERSVRSVDGGICPFRPCNTASPG